MTPAHHAARAHNPTRAARAADPEHTRAATAAHTTPDTARSARSASLRDEMAAPCRQGYDLWRVYRLGTGHTVQINIHRDSYQPQSYAVAKLLSADLRWEPIANEPASVWFTTTACYTATRTPAQILTQLQPIAQRLLTRAIAILS